MTVYGGLGVLALVIGTGAVCTVGTIYLRPLPASPPSVAQAPVLTVAPVRTVAWFTAHPVEMRAKIAACNNNPGEAKRDPECENASDALF